MPQLFRSATPRPARRSLPWAAAALVGAGWLVDHWRRERQAHRLHRALVDLLLNTLHAGDAYTERHSRRVADLTDALAETYGLSVRGRARLRIAALLHDVAKIDDRFFEIVHSCEPLTDEQRKAVEEHPQESADILQPLERIHPGITRIVQSHHERWDGEGYPEGLRAEAIPLEARIISVADVFDAMSQPRSYHDPLPIDETLSRIRESAGEKFDPEVVRRLEQPRVRRRWEEIARTGRRNERKAEERGDQEPVARSSSG